VGCWGLGVLGFLVTYLVAAQSLDEGLLTRMKGAACTACEVIVRRSKLCGGSVKECAEKGEAVVARVRLAADCRIEVRHVHVEPTGSMGS